MLAQFGRSHDGCADGAGSWRSKDSREDGYALHLEPELGKSWPVDIRTGFHYVANCVHRWVFHRCAERD